METGHHHGPALDSGSIVLLLLAAFRNDQSSDAMVPFLFLLKLRQQERAWLVGLAALYLCLGVLLMILLNPTPERASADLVKVFFNNSHTIVAALIGYGLALTAAYMTVYYERFRRWGM